MNWKLRLKYGLRAGLAAWLAGWLVSWLFELKVAWRYVDGHLALLPEALAKGMLVWAGFTLIMGSAGFFPLVLPLILVLPAGWAVRRRRLLIGLSPLAAMLAIDRRMGFLNVYNLRHREYIEDFFFTAPNFFVITFGLAAVWIYLVLAKRRLDLRDEQLPR